MKRIVLLFVVLAVLSGCASNGMHIKNGPENLGPKFDLTMHPELSVGVRITPDLEAGNVTVIEAPMHDSQVGGEMFPGRFNFPGWVRSKKGQEGFAQFVLTGNYPTGEFMSFAVIDGKLLDVKSAKYLPLSSRADYTWDKNGNIISIDRAQFYKDTAYREELVQKYGIPIGSRRLVRGFDKTIKSWNRYETKYGEIYSPYSEEDVKVIASINTGYTGLEKLILRNRAVISINPIEMIYRASLTVFRAMRGKSQGWDLNSELPTRMQMAVIVEFIGKFRMELIRELNKKIQEKDRQIVALKSEKKVRGK